MKFIRPTVIDDSRLASSSVSEADYPAWNAATAYAAGALVIRTTTHRVYKRVNAGTTATLPENDTVNWTAISRTNRWAMFDSKLTWVTTAADSITVVLAPGRVNALALLGVDASTVSVTLQAGGETVYSATLDLDSGNSVGNWYEYFYEPIYQQTEVVITDLVDAALLDMPAYGEGTLTVTLARPGGTVACALLVVGLLTEVGEMEQDAEVSIKDYSIKDPDPFATVPLLERDYSKRLSGVVVVPRAKVDSVVNIVSRYRATYLVFIGSKAYGCTVIYGFLEGWKMVLKNATHSKFSAQIEGGT